jgi:hypothetical protein
MLYQLVSADLPISPPEPSILQEKRITWPPNVSLSKKSQLDPRFIKAEASAMASDPIYDGYRLCFSRSQKYLFYALILIDPTTSEVGHLYRLRGAISLSFELQMIEEFQYDKNPSLAAKEKVFRMPQSFRQRFDMIVRQTNPPSHPNALTQSDPDPPSYTESHWIKDIVNRTNFQLWNPRFPPPDGLDSLSDSEEMERWTDGQMDRWRDGAQIGHAGPTLTPCKLNKT